MTAWIIYFFAMVSGVVYFVAKYVRDNSHAESRTHEVAQRVSYVAVRAAVVSGYILACAGGGWIWSHIIPRGYFFFKSAPFIDYALFGFLSSLPYIIYQVIAMARRMG